jgi:hypothetical protein
MLKYLEQGCPSHGTLAAFNPPVDFVWPARVVFSSTKCVNTSLLFRKYSCLKYFMKNVYEILCVIFTLISHDL